MAGTVLTIGVYDGVHRGHRALISETCRIGRDLGLPVTVLTFDRHPAELVSPETAPCLLTDLEQKVELLRSTGVDAVEVLAFDEERRREPAERFVDEILVRRYEAKAVVVGRNFHFGHKRSGNVALLEKMARFEVHGMELVPGDPAQAGGPAEPVSSTQIRRLLAEGAVEEASRLLGRDHEVRGAVVQGDGRARDLGAPTANIEVSERVCLPAEGIYAGWYVLETGEPRPAAVSLGTRPTFYGPEGALVLEAHLLDFDGDLYGTRARLRFSRRLRGQEAFDDPARLAEQMAADLHDARAALSETAG